MTGKIAVLVIGTVLAATLSLPASAMAAGRVHRGFNGPHVRGHGDFRHGHGPHHYHYGHGHFRNFRHQHFGHFPVHPGPRIGVHGGWRWTGWSWVWMPGHWR